MFNMYRRRFYARGGHYHGGSEEQLGHDRFNYMNPNVNYDKWPRRLRPKKSSAKVELEAPESPHLSEDKSIGQVRDCNGSLREHQRLLNLRAQRHKCSPRCRVKSPKSSSTNLSTEALVKVFACLGVQDPPNGGSSASSAPSPTPPLPPPQLQPPASGQHKNCPVKRPKKLSLFSMSSSPNSVRCTRYSSRSSSQACDNGGLEHLELERRNVGLCSSRSIDSRDVATELCRQYIRSSARYVLLDHMKDIGSRIDKSWFMIRDTSLKTERLLSVVPLSSGSSGTHHGCDISSSDADATRMALVDLFTALQHPYIYPILDVDFVYGMTAPSSYDDTARPALVSVFPFNSKGSLKDLIYRSRWQDDWAQKYRQRSEGLPLQQVQRLGRQILEALLFLREKGFPPFGHLHSGNIIIQNGVARLTGFENTLLGFSSRIYPMVKGILNGSAAAIDTVCFGHVLFEMCAGYELYAPKPTPRHLEDLQAYPQVLEVLDCIFNCPSDEVPTIGDLSAMEFFRNIDLREMRCSTIYFTAKLTDAAATLLEQAHQRRSRPPDIQFNEDDEYDDGDEELDDDRERQELLRQQQELEWQERRRRRMIRRTTDNGPVSGSLGSDPRVEAATLTGRHPLDSAYCASSPSLTVDFHPAAVLARRSFYSSDDSFRTPMESPDREGQLYWRSPLLSDDTVDQFTSFGRTSSATEGSSGAPEALAAGRR